MPMNTALAVGSESGVGSAIGCQPRLPDERDPGAALLLLGAASDAFTGLDDHPPASPPELLHAVAASLHRFSAAVIACEQAGIDRARLTPLIAPLRILHSRSPFVERLQTWPRGYAGDFETVEWLCDARNRAPAGTVAWAIEECSLQSPVAQQHRNKVDLQARAIFSTIVANPGARVASIGCGGCRDLALIQDYLPAGCGEFVLVDADPAALEFALRRLPRLAGRCEPIAGSVPRVLSRAIKTGPFDLIVAGGLFDYLPDRWAVATLRAIRTMLAPGGQLLFSNIAAGNPFRPWLEYLATWQLIERDENDLSRLLTAAQFPLDDRRIVRDTTSLALMVEVRLPDITERTMAIPIPIAAAADRSEHPPAAG
jgi:extracellular factor (EF) 3-hydroxypalmitic acid methyl ester biosynthesis protein